MCNQYGPRNSYAAFLALEHEKLLSAGPKAMLRILLEFISSQSYLHLGKNVPGNYFTAPVLNTAGSAETACFFKLS